jgi:uncharacterized OsmC-like protein
MSQIDVDYKTGLSTECILTGSSAKIELDAAGASGKFSPTDLFAASLGACVLTVMGHPAQKLQLDFSRASASVSKEMDAGPPRRIGRLEVLCKIPHLYGEQLQKKFEETALQCPVHHSIHPETEVVIRFEWGSP